MSDLEPCHLGKRHGYPIPRHDGEVTDAAEVEPLRCDGARHHIHMLGAIPNGGNRCA